MDLLLVLVCGGIWMIEPQSGRWIIMIAFLPWGTRLVAGQFPFRRTFLDWLIAIFLVTAWVGYWAAYDKTIAWNKVWLIMTAILLYYALVGQPKENLLWISILFFCVGIGVSLYYFLTYDFVAAPRRLEMVNRLGRWLMDVRPQTGWTSIHPNYVAGLAAITAPFVIHPLSELRRKTERPPLLFHALTIVGLGIVFLALLMTTSRGALMAIVSGAGIWLLGRLANSNGIRHLVKNEAFFSCTVLIYLCIIIAFLYIGPASSGSILPGNYHFGDGSRVELLSRSLYLLRDYPITGGGLGSFPGLYSQYLLNIPFFNVPNSHNLFLDVAIEQGLLGGLAFVLIYLASIWIVSRSLMQEKGIETSVLNWIVLFCLIVVFVHGMVDDYLYSGNGTILSLVFAAISVLLTQGKDISRRDTFLLDRRMAGYVLLLIAVMFVLRPRRVLSTWYANLGSVQMSQVELDGYPNSGWAGSKIVSRLDDAEAALRSSLQLDPSNRTANQRLGMISMLRQDFESASGYLEAAYREAPEHRGIIKSLGYCYVWLGDMQRADTYLSLIPEAQEELDAYIWWWEMQGRGDLSDSATSALQVLKLTTSQP
jgi:hypothetical protein